MSESGEHNEIMYMLGKVDSNIEGILKHLEALNSKTLKHSERLDDLERTNLIRKTKIATYGGISGVAASVAVWFVNHIFFSK